MHPHRRDALRRCSGQAEYAEDGCLNGPPDNGALPRKNVGGHGGHRFGGRLPGTATARHSPTRYTNPQGVSRPGRGRLHAWVFRIPPKGPEAPGRNGRPSTLLGGRRFPLRAVPMLNRLRKPKHPTPCALRLCVRQEMLTPPRGHRLVGAVGPVYLAGNQGGAS